MRVLGVDPGSAATGWAVVERRGRRLHLAASGVIRSGRGSRSERLARIAAALRDVLEAFAPEEAAVETPFFGRFPRSSLQLAETRGAILAVLGGAGIPVGDYSPAQVKMTVVGFGGAEKEQVVFMVRRLLRLQDDPPTDAADAMAVALAHLQTSSFRAVADRLDPR